jgi:phosphinothricin acetyltransferase
MGIDIEAMTPADWEQVRAIYQEGIASGQATFEIEAPSWTQWDAGHHSFGRLVARAGGRVVGWAALSPVSRRRCYAGVAEVSVYVAADHRGRDVGRQLLQAVIGESERHGIWTLQGGTFAENEASLRLQRSCGFRVLGRRERIAQHHGVWRDTILTERRSPIVGTDDSSSEPTIFGRKPTMHRPSSTEYAPYYETYIALVPEDDILAALEAQLGETLAVVRGLPESRGGERHPPYTWSIKEVIGHLADTERVMGYRALRFARGDSTPLPGFDENAFARAAAFDRVPLKDLVGEFEAVRRSNLYLFRGLDEAAWSRRGEANSNAVTVRALAYIIAGHARHHTAILRRRLSGVPASSHS